MNSALSFLMSFVMLTFSQLESRAQHLEGHTYQSSVRGPNTAVSEWQFSAVYYDGGSTLSDEDSVHFESTSQEGKNRVLLALFHDLKLKNYFAFDTSRESTNGDVAISEFDTGFVVVLHLENDTITIGRGNGSTIDLRHHTGESTTILAKYNMDLELEWYYADDNWQPRSGLLIDSKGDIYVLGDFTGVIFPDTDHELVSKINTGSGLRTAFLAQLTWDGMLKTSAKANVIESSADKVGGTPSLHGALRHDSVYVEFQNSLYVGSLIPDSIVFESKEGRMAYPYQIAHESAHDTLHSRVIYIGAKEPLAECKTRMNDASDIYTNVTSLGVVFSGKANDFLIINGEEQAVMSEARNVGFVSSTGFGKDIQCYRSEFEIRSLIPASGGLLVSAHHLGDLFDTINMSVNDSNPYHVRVDQIQGRYILGFLSTDFKIQWAVNFPYTGSMFENEGEIILGARFTQNQDVNIARSLKYQLPATGFAFARYSCRPFANWEFGNISGKTYDFVNLSNLNQTNFLWIFGDEATDTAKHSTYTFKGSGMTAAMLVTSNSCGSDSFWRQFLVVGEEGHQTTPLKIYPNPTTSTIRIPEHLKGATTTAEVFSLEGKRLKAVNVLSPVIDLKDLNPGTYILVITHEGTRYSASIFKQDP